MENGRHRVSVPVFFGEHLEIHSWESPEQNGTKYVGSWGYIYIKKEKCSSTLTILTRFGISGRYHKKAGSIWGLNTFFFLGTFFKVFVGSQGT